METNAMNAGNIDKKGAAQRLKPSLRSIDPQLEGSTNLIRGRIDALLVAVDVNDSARGLLGCDIVAATESGIHRARIIKTRAFEGIGKSTTNRDSIKQGAGMVYIMKHRSAKFLNITTGREGNPSCVWVEEAVDIATGKMIKNNELLRFLQLENSDREPIFSESTAIVAGETPKEIKTIDLITAKASKNTTGVYRAVFEDDKIANQLDHAVDTYLA